MLLSPQLFAHPRKRISEGPMSLVVAGHLPQYTHRLVSSGDARSLQSLVDAYDQRISLGHEHLYQQP